MHYLLAFYLGGGFSMAAVWFLRNRGELSKDKDPFLAALAALVTLALVIIIWPYFVYIAARDGHA